ncbi:MAG TPA: FtsX-like permease family protein, partial [Ktedonobacterales bacterium]|nr:FtsX-like permease family protein [Ktedonobacterales bacterium]
ATLQQLTSAQDEINHIYVANAGDGLTGVGYSDEITRVAYAALQGNLRVDEVKQDGVQLALRAQDIFGRILTLYTSFALALGLLLIFLIFVLLAAERRAELGMARALGMRRSHVVGLLLFEGATYDGVAAAFGILAGLGLGLLVVKLVSPTLTHIGFPLQIAVQTQSVVVAFCLGLVFTLATIWLAAWTVSRMTVAAALRDLPEPPSPAPSLFGLARALVVALSRVFINPLLLPSAALRLAWALTARGLVLLVVGRWLLDRANEREDVLLLSLGVSCLLAGAVLLLRWLALTTVSAVARATRPRQALHTLVRATIVADRLSALCVGGGLALYWSLPYDSLAAIGLPRFTGGVETFFVAGVMMVFGAVWALAPNLDLLLAPVRWLLSRIGRSRHVARMALVYPSQHRFRTGVGLALFSLVCFTMVTMACIAASTTANYDNVPVQAAGYDVAGQPLFAPVGGSARLSAALHGSSGADGLSAVSSATPLPLGILQPGAPNARWSIYPVSQVDGAFLDGVGLPLVARASGYASDNAVWQAVGRRSGYVVVDAGALSGADATALGLTAPPGLTPSQLIGPPIASGLPGLASLESLAADPPGGGESASTQAFPLPIGDFSLGELQLKLRNVAVGQGTIAPTPIWVADARGGPAVKLTIIGIVQDVHGERRGLFGSAGTFAPVEQDLTPFGNEYYYFKVHAGVDAHEEALSLGSTLLNYGFETTVLQDVLLDVNGPRVFISRVLVGLVGLTLLVGMAALAVSGSRSVVERRQQIGMLRALGFHRGLVQALFVAESLLVGAAGTAVGLFFGLILCQNMFAVDFFERFQSGLSLVVPWQELAVICAAALSASALASLLPAWQAGRIAPADALRYE